MPHSALYSSILTREARGNIYADRRVRGPPSCDPTLCDPIGWALLRYGALRFIAARRKKWSALSSSPAILGKTYGLTPPSSGVLKAPRTSYFATASIGECVEARLYRERQAAQKISRVLGSPHVSQPRKIPSGS